MLKLIIGKAGTGKTRAVIDEIAKSVSDGKGDNYLIVPEQYSYEAERELLIAAGDSLSLYAEVLSFTGLARKLEDICGRGSRVLLDGAGRLLSMAYAAGSLGSQVGALREIKSSAQMQKSTLGIVSELKTAGVTNEELADIAARLNDSENPEYNPILSDKLSDLAVLYAAYDALIEKEGKLDPSDRLSILLQNIKTGVFGTEARFYFDGFVDFTGLQMQIISELLTIAESVTVCLTLDAVNEGRDVFIPAGTAALHLLDIAKEKNIPAECEKADAEQEDSLPIAYLCEHLFDFSSADPSAVNTQLADKSVFLYSAATKNEECEFAAALALQHVKAGCRWSDIAVAVRNFEDYRLSLEAAFSYYGVPLYLARKSEMRDKPLPFIISSAYEIPDMQFAADAVFPYLRTGLCGLSPEECDLLENYVITWEPDAFSWALDRTWKMHPRGYGNSIKEADALELKLINELKNRAAAPLFDLYEKSQKAKTARKQADALLEFLDDINIAEEFSNKTAKLISEGRASEAFEYSQLWDMTMSALSQFVLLFGDTEIDRAKFSELIILALSEYTVGTVPVSLDMVSAGDFDRMRKRHIKHLIILGASDERLPAPAADSGLLSIDDREMLVSSGLAISAGEAEIWREFALIYNTVSLPSDTLTIVSPLFDSGGKAARPSILHRRAEDLLGVKNRYISSKASKLQSLKPALELVSAAIKGAESSESLAAYNYFSENDPEVIKRLRTVSLQKADRLDSEAVSLLYGRNLKLSPSAADRYSECKYKHFFSYGLRAYLRKAADFNQFEYGNLIHYLLENVVREASNRGGFEKLSDFELKSLCDLYFERFAKETLGPAQDLSPRFLHLFRRLKSDVYAVIYRLAEDIKNSSFKPISFELDFSKIDANSPIALPEGEVLYISGKADRVDGWESDDKLYLRVVDYKTGNVKFSLPDVLSGRYLQMLIYLFTLARVGDDYYKKKVMPAGVLYYPAKDVMVSAKHNLTDDEIAAEKDKKLKSTGLLLDEESVSLAMNIGASGKGYNLASAEQLGKLGRHIKKTLTEIALGIKGGNISARHYYKSDSDNACFYCDYKSACYFAEGSDACSRLYPKKVSEEEFWNLIGEEA